MKEYEDIRKNSLFYIIKSFNIENIHKALKYGVWSTTYSGNILFNDAFTIAKQTKSNVYLFFSTNSTFAFQGLAKLTSGFQKNSFSFWKGSDKYKHFNGSFKIKWIIIKDIPNSTLDEVYLYMLIYHRSVDNIPFSKLRNAYEVPEKDAIRAIEIMKKFYYYSSLVLNEFKNFDEEESKIEREDY